MRVMILAGSGLSAPAGYPSTNALTETVLSGHNVFRHSDSAYYFDNGGDPSGPRTKALVMAFLHPLRGLVAGYYAPWPDRSVNYEDLAYLVGQFADSESGEYDNPALKPMHDLLGPQVEALLHDVGPGHEEWSVPELAEETRRYIADVVWRSLQGERDGMYLRPLVEFIRDGRLEDVSVFTLNHDTLLERTLAGAGIDVVDGFGEVVSGVRYWRPELFGESRLTRRLVKLHGSVDWFLLCPDDGGFHEERVGQVSGDPWHTHDSSGRLQLPLDGRPMLLVGTHNKAMSYLKPPFYDAHVEFYRRLNRDGVRVMVVIGYGGQDKIVNERIVDWMESVPSRRLVIVNRSGDTLVRRCRGALARGIERWQGESRVEIIARDIRDVSMADYVASVGL